MLFRLVAIYKIFVLLECFTVYIFTNHINSYNVRSIVTVLMMKDPSKCGRCLNSLEIFEWSSSLEQILLVMESLGLFYFTELVK